MTKRDKSNSIDTPMLEVCTLFVCMCTFYWGIFLCFFFTITAKGQVDQTWVCDDVKIPNLPSQIDFLTIDPIGRLLIGSSSGLFAYDGVETSEVFSGIQSNEILAVQSDTDSSTLFVLTEYDVYRLVVDMKSDTPDLIRNFKNRITNYDLSDKYLAFYHEESVNVLDLRNGNISKSSYAGGKVELLKLVQDRLYIFGETVCVWYSVSDQLHCKDDIDINTIRDAQVTDDHVILFNEDGNFNILDSELNPLFNYDAGYGEDEKLFRGSQAFYSALNGSLVKWSLKNELPQLIIRSNSCLPKITDLQYVDEKYVWVTDGKNIKLLRNKHPIVADSELGFDTDEILTLFNRNDQLYFTTSNGRLYNLHYKFLSSSFPDTLLQPYYFHQFKWTSKAYLTVTDRGLYKSEETSVWWSETLDIGFGHTWNSAEKLNDSTLVLGSDAGAFFCSVDSQYRLSCKRRFRTTIPSVGQLYALFNGDCFIASGNKIYYYDIRKDDLNLFYSHVSDLNDFSIFNGKLFAVSDSHLVQIPLPGSGESRKIFQYDELGIAPPYVAINNSEKGLFLSSPDKTSFYTWQGIQKKKIVSEGDYDYSIRSNGIINYNHHDYLATNVGVVLFESNSKDLSKLGAPQLIRCSANGKQIPASELQKLEEDQNNLELQVRMIQPQLSGPFQYRWKLYQGKRLMNEYVGGESNRFTELSPGNYTMDVVGIYGNEASYPLQFDLKIDSPFYKKKEFVIYTIVGTTLMILLLVVIVRRLQIKKKRKFREDLYQENELQTLRQQALQLQMNPHFIFNAMNGIQSLIGTDEVGARRWTSKLAKLMRLTLKHSRLTWVALNDEIELLKTYLDLEQFQHGFSYDVENQIKDKDVYIPPMMLQPLIENAVHHGVSALKSEGKILVSFSFLGKKVRVMVRDNGLGLGKSQRSGDHLSISTKIINERMDLFKKSGIKVDPATIQNVSEEGKSGVEVYIGLPYQKSKSYE